MDYDEWLNALEIGDEVVVEQPSYRFRYYRTVISDVDKDGVCAKGFSGVLFEDGQSMIGGYRYLLLKPIDEILDTINLINCQVRLKSTDWYKVEDDTVMDVYDLVYGD